MKGRLVAVVLAIALVAGAFVVRRNVIDDDDEAAGDDEATELVCATELADICSAYADAGADVDVTIEEAGLTVDRLAAIGEDADPPLWLTVEPYPQMVDGVRASRGAAPLAYTSTPLGASQLAIALPPDGRLDALLAACGEGPLWDCIGDAAGQPWSDLGGEAGWGTVRPAFGDVDDSALGLASFAAAVAGYLGSAEFGRSQWEADLPAFLSWVRPLADVASGVSLSGGTALGTMATRPSALDIAATADFERAALDADSSRFDGTYPAPEMWMEAVLAVPDGGGAPDDLAPELIDRLRAAGWDDPSTASAPLPGATTMLALQALWQDAA